MDFDTSFFFKYIYYPGVCEIQSIHGNIDQALEHIKKGHFFILGKKWFSIHRTGTLLANIQRYSRNIPNCFRNIHFYHRQRDLMENQSVKHIFHNTSHKHIKCLLSIFSNIREEVEKTHLLFKEYFRVITVGHKYMALDPYFKRR